MQSSSQNLNLHRGDRINSAYKAELRIGDITRISRLGSLSTVVSTVSDLIHARAPRSIGMAFTHGELFPRRAAIPVGQPRNVPRQR